MEQTKINAIKTKQNKIGYNKSPLKSILFCGLMGLGMVGISTNNLMSAPTEKELKDTKTKLKTFFQTQADARIKEQYRGQYVKEFQLSAVLLKAFQYNLITAQQIDNLIGELKNLSGRMNLDITILPQLLTKNHYNRNLVRIQIKGISPTEVDRYVECLKTFDANNLFEFRKGNSENAITYLGIPMPPKGTVNIKAFYLNPNNWKQKQLEN